MQKSGKLYLVFIIQQKKGSVHSEQTYLVFCDSVLRLLIPCTGQPEYDGWDSEEKEA